AVLVAGSLASVVAEPHGGEARTALLRGASRGGQALALAGLGLAHAMSQALGGRYGLPHGAMNALCLSPGLRFAAAQAPEAVERFGHAIGEVSVEDLARLGSFERLRDFGVPEAELPEVAAAA